MGIIFLTAVNAHHKKHLSYITFIQFYINFSHSDQTIQLNGLITIINLALLLPMADPLSHVGTNTMDLYTPQETNNIHRAASIHTHIVHLHL